MKGTEDACRSSGNIFADLELADAQELHLKSSLVIELRRQIEGRKLTQTAAATILAIQAAARRLAWYVRRALDADADRLRSGCGDHRTPASEDR